MPFNIYKKNAVQLGYPNPHSPHLSPVYHGTLGYVTPVTYSITKWLSLTGPTFDRYLRSRHRCGPSGVVEETCGISTIWISQRKEKL